MLFHNVLRKVKRKQRNCKRLFGVILLVKVFLVVFKPAVSTIDFKQENNKCKVSAWKSKGVYSSKLCPLHNL